MRLSQRELSRISLAVVVIVVCALGFGLYRLFVNFRSARDIVIAKENLLTIYKAAILRSDDWEHHLPEADKWTDQVAGYLTAPPNTPGGPMSYLQGSGDGSQPIGYVYNDLASDYNLEPGGNDTKSRNIDPSRLVLLIERPGVGSNAHVSIPPQVSQEAEQALYKQLSFPHYSDDPKNATTVVLFASGRIVTMTRQDFAQSGDQQP